MDFIEELGYLAIFKKLNYEWLERHLMIWLDFFI